MKTKPRETKPEDPARDELQEVLEALFGGLKPAGRLRAGLLKLRYVLFGRTSIFSRRIEPLSAAVAI